MKKTSLLKYGKSLTFLTVVGLFLLNACNILSSSHSSTAGPVVTGVRDIHPDSSAVSKVGPGETIVIEGKHLATTQKVDFDGYATTINQTLYTDTTVIATLPATLPFGQVKSDSLNTIHVVTKYGQTTYKFPVLPPGPVISYVSNEFASAGTEITITGQYLYFVKSVIFPGGIKATKYSSAPDGTSMQVTVPSGVSQSGTIEIETQSGTCTSGPDHILYDKDHVFLNFDSKNAYTTWNTPQDPVIITPQSQTPDSVYDGGGNKVKLDMTYPDISMQSGNYLRWDVVDIPVGSWWIQHLATPTNGANLAWPTDIPASTSASNLAIKFEINVPGNGLSSGEVKFQISDDSHDYYWKPWTNTSSGTYKTNGWETVTIPLTDFPGISTYGDVKGNAFNIFYDNGNGSSNVAWVDIGWDNFRIVPQ